MPPDTASGYRIRDPTAGRAPALLLFDDDTLVLSTSRAPSTSLAGSAKTLVTSPVKRNIGTAVGTSNDLYPVWTCPGYGSGWLTRFAAVVRAVSEKLSSNPLTDLRSDCLRLGGDMRVRSQMPRAFWS
ncbi:hypothetical protein ACBJ59_53840 [Nonomuraea sp. MTCD27]|uniref:hypothetical protein n=1 Tax=Nonomuraea sp. MTCD27 TaxID=1676747 RepID=UPI0035C1B34C